MARQSTSQFDTSQAPASNPASGINNIPLQGGEGGGEGSAIGGGVKASECLPILKKIAHGTPQSSLDFQHDIEGFRDGVKDETLKQLFDALISSILTNQEQGKRTSDPRTGEPDPMPQDLANDLIEKIENMTKKSGSSDHAPANHHSNHSEKASKPQTALQGDTSKHLTPGGQDQPPHTALQSGIPFMPVASSGVYNYRVAAEQRKKKKKTRGNPFRVLMGQVGKLLDHGLEKRDIIRYLLKRKMFNEETISRCVDVVRDYNRKKNHDGDDSAPKQDKVLDDKAEKANVQNDALPLPSPLEQNISMASSAVYNYRRSQAARREEASTIYDQKPDWEKRSSAELFSRMSFLLDLQDYGKDTLQGSGKKAADTTGAAAEFKAVKAELSRRGWSDEELPQKKQTMLNKAEKPRADNTNPPNFSAKPSGA